MIETQRALAPTAPVVYDAPRTLGIIAIVLGILALPGALAYQGYIWLANQTSVGAVQPVSYTASEVLLSPVTLIAFAGVMLPAAFALIATLLVLRSKDGAAKLPKVVPVAFFLSLPSTLLVVVPTVGLFS